MIDLTDLGLESPRSNEPPEANGTRPVMNGIAATVYEECGVEAVTLALRDAIDNCYWRDELPLWLMLAVAGDPGTAPRIAFEGHPESVERIIGRAGSRLVRDGYRAGTLMMVVGHEWERRQAASDRLAHPDALDYLSSDPEEDVRRAVAANPSAAAHVLIALARAPEQEEDDEDGAHVLEARCPVRSALAANPAAPPEALDALVDWRLTGMTYNADVARHANTSGAMLRSLAAGSRHHSWGNDGIRWRREAIRTAVAANPHTPADALDDLARDDSRSVRRAVASNPNARESTLGRLGNDEDEWIYRAVIGNRMTPIDILRQMISCAPEVGTRYWALRSGRAPADLLIRAATESEAALRDAVAINHRTPPEVFTLLARDTSVEVRRSAARNPMTPNIALAILATDTDTDVRRAVAKHDRAKESTLLMVLDITDDWSGESIVKSRWKRERERIDGPEYPDDQNVWSDLKPRPGNGDDDF